MKYIKNPDPKKPIIVEAIQWDGNNTQDVLDFCGGNHKPTSEGHINPNQPVIYFNSYRNEMYYIKSCHLTDWIIKDEKGYQHSFSDEFFKKSYSILVE